MVSRELAQGDALEYLKVVKLESKDNPVVYDEFLQVMKDFRNGRIDTNCVVMRVRELFKDKPDLLFGFNAFLPHGYNVAIRPNEFEEAISFVNMIKARFWEDDSPYKSFLDIMDAHEKRTKSTAETYQEVANLFRDHNDLLVEFTRFLPGTLAAASIKPPDKKEQIMSSPPSLDHEKSWTNENSEQVKPTDTEKNKNKGNGYNDKSSRGKDKLSQAKIWSILGCLAVVLFGIVCIFPAHQANHHKYGNEQEGVPVSVGPIFAIPTALTLAAMAFTVFNTTETHLSAKLDLLINSNNNNIYSPEDLHEASFVYKNVTFTTTSIHSYFNLKPYWAVSAIVYEENIDERIGKNIMDDIKDKGEVRIGSTRLLFLDSREERSGMMISYVCDEATLRFESGSQRTASVFGNHLITCLHLH